MINIAVVGCGYWGPNLIRNFHALPDCRVRRICDASRERLEHIGRLYPTAELTEDFDSLLEDPQLDAVVIVTPVHTHYALAKQSLLAGKHTFIEKPMATSVQECQELIDLAKKQSVVLVIGHTFVYNPTVRKIKELIDAGELGDIMYISSRRLNLGLIQYDINVAWDLAPHDISIILYLLGKPPISVNCQGKAHIKPGIEDVTSIAMNYENGGFALIHSSWIDPKKVRETTIVGSKKMLIYDDNEPLEKIKIYDKCVEKPPHYDTFAEFQYSYRYGDMHAPWIKLVEPLKVECQCFLDSIRTGEVCESSGEDGLKVVQVLEAASQSLKNDGLPVRLPLAN